ncbi:MAG TPA: energy-coupling factor transporter transmembrane component T [Chloroflexota bacterium]|nr:energy-coupling factor transporter transmembrane component T [Chloroflexota bacterium]
MIASGPQLLSYQTGTSFLHRLDPRTKLLGAAVIVTGVLLAGRPSAMVAAYLLGAAAGLLARSLLPALARTLRPLVILIIIFGIIITFVTPGHALFRIGPIVFTQDGLDLAVRLGLQALLIVYGTSLLTLTTPPLSLAAAMEWVLGFLRWFKVPVRDIIAMVAIGLTFVPLLIEEVQKVIAAQRARGADLSMMSLLDEDSMGALMIPLLLANLRRGEELADSMEARLYGTGPRSSLVVWHWSRTDLFTSIVLLLTLAVIAALAFTPLGKF